MQKANGRLHPRKNKESAEKKGKLYKCAICFAEERILNPEFGVEYKCPKCPGMLVEQVDIE